MNRGQALYQRAKRIIPGGTQLLSKRPELHLPDLWPPYYTKAKGCHIWDLEGRKICDMSFMGIGACILGYADSDVDRAVRGAIQKGTMTTLNCPEEVELAELLCKIHPWAKMVRYARTGGEAMSIAVRIARAYSRKDIILFCGYHGWHDWYLSVNLNGNGSLDNHLLPGLKPRGVPNNLKGTVVPFDYNDTQAFIALAKKYGGRIAAVVMEPLRNHEPQKGFLETIRKITKQKGITLIFDEITSGWRLNWGGAHLKFKVYPDIAVFAKGISNGYPMAAIIGRENVMNSAQDTFISSTYWTERIGPTAALATIRKLKEKKVAAHLTEAGRQVKEGWMDSARRHRLEIKISGIDPLAHFEFQRQPALLYKTLFTQSMLEQGFLATNSYYASYAHKSAQIERYLAAVERTFAWLSTIISEGRAQKHLKGAVCQSGFKRLN